ncbi:hypothetical protein [Streptomyces sp. BK340]|uniref:hypothetical protein n=1 Tax=Streptomyces sp. BK340 TaxID=2572903 RepID=UPI0011A65AA8|nr:hypothetical protein [Streptomyces sp. BK340]TVZ96528.1 hypothetical protein FB157_103439 [Streptomyces sp. BK340]
MPGLVPQIAALRRRLAITLAPARASGEASNGEPVQVELFIGGAWVDITATSSVLVRDDSGNIAITKGIRDEGSQTDPSTCALELRNTDGRFSPRNPNGPYYGLIGRNTPVRVSVPDGNGGKSYRIWGEISEWVPNWDTSGSDVWTDVSASGILRRLAQGPAPERSVIYNAITDPLPSSVVAYWPMEDPTGSTSLASALTSGSAMTWTGVPVLASYSGFTASDPLPDLTSATLSGGVTKYADPTATQVRFLAYIPAAGLGLGKVLVAIDQLDYSAGASQFWEVFYDTATTSFTIRTCADDGTVLGAELQHSLDVRGRLLYVSVELQEAGANITRTLRLKDVSNSRTYTVSDTVFTTQLTRVTRVQFGPASRAVSGAAGTANLPGVAVGHATVENAITDIAALGVRLNPIGETAGRRIQRLCDEAGIAFGWVGDLDDTVPLGAQSKANTLSLVQEAVLADGGILYENPSVLGLGYRTRASLHNQDPVVTLDYTAGQLDGSKIPTPVEDDRYIQNKVTVTCSGVSQTAEETSGTLSTALPPAGVGVYGQETTLNLASTDEATLLDQAAWRVHLGTVDEARFPQISVNLAHPSITADMRRAIIGMRLGDRIQITNPPAWLPPDTIDQLVLGISETITRLEHKLTFQCAPASPYSSIGVLDDADSRIDTDGSELVGTLTTTDTVAGVQPSSGFDGLWTKDPADFPLDVEISGEVIRVTSIADLVTDTFGRTVSSNWGTNDSGLTWTLGGGSASDYSVGSGVGAHLLSTIGNSRRCTVGTTITDMDMYVSITADQLATGDFLAGGLAQRFLDLDNLYSAQLRFTTSTTIQVVIIKRVAATETILGTYTMAAVTFVAGTFYRLRFKVNGSLLRAKAWLATDAETPEWQVSVMDGDLVTPTFLGVRSIAGSASTNVNPSIKYDDFAVVSPQRWSLTRSINGVVKTHSRGEAVSLATPTYLAL